MEKICVLIIVFGCFLLTEIIAEPCYILLQRCSCSAPLCCSNGKITTCNSDVTQNVVTRCTSTNSSRRDNCNCSKCQTECPLSTTVHTSDVTKDDWAETTTNMSQDCSSGRIVGSVIGGAVFGSLVTVLVFMLHRRIQKKQIRNRAVETLQNPAYNAETMSMNERAEEENTGKSTYSEISDQKSMKVSHVAPIRRNENTSKTSDGVYNHLNETASDDRSEYYDHAKPGASVSTPADGYCTVTIDNGGNDEHIEDNKNNE